MNFVIQFPSEIKFLQILNEFLTVEKCDLDRQFLSHLYLLNFSSSHMEAKLLKYHWLMRKAFFLNSGEELLDTDWLRHFILSIRTNIKSIHNKGFFYKYRSLHKIYHILNFASVLSRLQPTYE